MTNRSSKTKKRPAEVKGACNQNAHHSLALPGKMVEPVGTVVLYDVTCKLSQGSKQ